nr:hypothetical protein [Rhodococcus sp. JVH1]EJI93814.1 hypothetical protein JVH1_8851 [Rhodococcus sp. JVH1]
MRLYWRGDQLHVGYLATGIADEDFAASRSRDLSVCDLDGF